jgi:hypothetical protein
MVGPFPAKQRDHERYSRCCSRVRIEKAAVQHAVARGKQCRGRCRLRQSKAIRAGLFTTALHQRRGATYEQVALPQ